MFTTERSGNITIVLMDLLWNIVTHRLHRKDFYGRGHSDSPLLVIHNEDLFVSQAVELLQALEAKGEISSAQHKQHHILGWSLGGAVSLVYASLYPDRILSAILVSAVRSYSDSNYRLHLLVYLLRFQ
jgi:pimeloyl-ACP methyl ester carboxylesterase